MPKTSIKVGNKIYKLREDREFMSKCVVLSRSRPELLGKLDELIGHYEMSVFPRALFSSDGRLLISKDKSHLMNLIIEKQPQRQISNKAEEKKNVLIIDAMCEVQALKKSPDTTKMIHLKELSISERGWIVLDYRKVRDCWDSTISQEAIGEENL